TEAMPDDRPAAGSSLSATAKNGRVRVDRREAWQMAEAARHYWEVRLKFEDQIRHVQKMGMSEGRSHPALEWDDRWPLLDKWRAAIAKQLLTAAPDAAAVKWKQATLANGGSKRAGLSPERVERAIADDLAFLAAHPVRRSNSEAMARSREFKEAMRRRIRDIAATRDLSDDEIRPVLRLKHSEIGEFCRKHGVSLQWLLEGAGPIFKKYPI